MDEKISYAKLCWFFSPRPQCVEHSNARHNFYFQSFEYHRKMGPFYLPVRQVCTIRIGDAFYITMPLLCNTWLFFPTYFPETSLSYPKKASCGLSFVTAKSNHCLKSVIEVLCAKRALFHLGIKIEPNTVFTSDKTVNTSPHKYKIMTSLMMLLQCIFGNYSIRDA